MISLAKRCYKGTFYFKLGDDGLYHGELIKEPLELETLIQKILDERASPANTP